jgi:hypothetical protein
MSANTLPLKLGQVSTSGDLARLLGQQFRIDDPDGILGTRMFIVVRASANITSPQRKTVISAIDGTSLQPTWQVNTTTSANQPVALVIPTDYGTTQINSGEYFLAQWAGVCEVITTAAGSVGQAAGTGTTAGQVTGLAAAGTVGLSAIPLTLTSAGGTAATAGAILRG